MAGNMNILPRKNYKTKDQIKGFQTETKIKGWPLKQRIL